ncbi:COG3476 Tryptophan-rich sensory protein (mitochondrial benzodiazepine receptor homolog) [Candidatus Nanopelagicaceae bacterium]
MKLIASSIGVALVLIYVIGSGLWVNTGDGWYRGLNQPAWQPPDFIFGIIWPYNFIVLGFAAVIVSNRLSAALVATYLIVFAITVACALTWAFQFYRPHNLEAASTALSCVAVLTIVLVVIASRASLPLALALLPYQVWVLIASFLSWTYARLN